MRAQVQRIIRPAKVEAFFRSEIANRRIVDDMKTAASMKDQFVSLVSHELRVPIGTVVGNGLLLLKYSAALSEQDKLQAAEGVVTEGERVQRVIENTQVYRQRLAHGPVPLLLSADIRRRSVSASTFRPARATSPTRCSTRSLAATRTHYTIRRTDPRAGFSLTKP